MIRAFILLLLTRCCISTCCATLKLSDASPTTSLADLSVLHQGAAQSKDLAYRLTVLFSPDYPSTEPPKSINNIECRSLAGKNGWDCSGQGVKTFTAQFLLTKPFSAVQNSTVRSELVASITAYGTPCGIQNACESQAATEASADSVDLVDLGPFGQRPKLLVIGIGIGFGVLFIAIIYALWRKAHPKKKYMDYSHAPDPEADMPPKYKQYDEEYGMKRLETKKVKEEELVRVPKPALSRNASREFHEVRRSTSRKSRAESDREGTRNRSFDAPVDEMPPVPGSIGPSKAKPKNSVEETLPKQRSKSSRGRRKEEDDPPVRRAASSKSQHRVAAPVEDMPARRSTSVKSRKSNKSHRSHKRNQSEGSSVHRSGSSKSRHRIRAPQEEMPAVKRSASSKSHKKKERAISVKVKTTGVGPRIRQVLVEDDHSSIPASAKTLKRS